ncbi:MAG: WYL domain-containing protein [Clostridia bacterium]|nr:WYL domain-containing protein [Clostridia bacterium]
MQVNITEGGKKIQLLYVLWVLENFSDKDNTLKQDDIVEILRKKGYSTERKSVARDLKLLLDFGYKIHGIEPELDEDGNELHLKRGAIWLEREFSDEQLSLLLNSVAYNVFVEKNNKEELLNNIIYLGGKTFREKHNANSLINGGKIYQVEGTTLLNQLKAIEKAMETEKRIRFKYASKLKREGDSFVYEKNKEYVVSPYWVVSKNGNLYLVCFNHSENRIWNCRIDKIREVEVIKSSATPKKDTELKDTSVGDYVSKHPNMFTGDAISIELKVNKTRMGHVYETFRDVTFINETEDYLTVKVTCGELDMFYWAIQYGGFVEVLKPQSLRDKIRVHIESLAFNYKAKEGDKYSEAIRNAIRTKVLDLSGIDLTGKKEHFGLKTIKKVYLSNNNIDNVDFLRDYHWLQELQLENNNVTDLTCLSGLRGLRKVTLKNLKLKKLDFVHDKYFSKLFLDLDRETDYSALLNIRNKDCLIFADRCEMYSSIPWQEFINEKIKFAFEREISKVEETENEVLVKFVKPFIFEKFPFNFLKYAFGNWAIKPDKIVEVENAVDKVFDKFTNNEKRYLEVCYKQRITNKKEIIENLVISEKEYDEITNEIEEKIKRSQICDDLREFFIDGALKGDFSEADRLLNNIELSENLEKIEKARKRKFEKSLKIN